MEASGSPARGGGLDFADKAVVLSGGVLAGMALAAINPVLPSIDKDLARSATDSMLVKQLVGGVSFAMAIGAPLGGFLLGWLGMRRLLLAASLVFAIAGTAGFYLTSLPLLLVSRLFLGAAAASIQVMSITLINTRLPGADRARWMGLHVSVATVSMLFVMGLAGVLGEIGWRWPFLEYGAGLLLFAVLLLGGKSGMASASHAPAAAPAASASEPEGSILSWFPWHYLLLSLLIGSVTFMPTVYLPYLLREGAGLTPGGIAAIQAGASVIGALSALLYGRARTSISAHAAFAVAFGLAGLGALLMANGVILWLMLIGMAIYASGNGWFVPNIMTALGARVTQQQQARAAGLVKAAHFLSTPLCILLIDPYARQSGAAAVMLVVAAIGATMLVVSLLRMASAGRARQAAAG